PAPLYARSLCLHAALPIFDYVGVKALPLAIVGWMLWRGSLRADELGLDARPWTTMIAVFLVVAVAGTLVDQNGYRLIAELPGYPDRKSTRLNSSHVKISYA